MIKMDNLPTIKLHEALFYKKLKNNFVNCNLCPRNCIIKEDARGDCRVRENIDGKLISLVYNHAVSMSLDPIEKKPLFHFLPNERTLSFGTAGCNLHCLHCQNWEIAQNPPEKVANIFAPPKKIVEEAVKYKAKIIGYTYNEPTVFYEYALDTMKLARKQKIKNIIVSNGFTNKNPILNWSKYLDGANIDLKGGKKFYEKICSAWLEPILKAVELYHKKKIWLEITSLIVPGYNDKEKNIKEIIKFVKLLDEDIPLHFSAFYPSYRLLNIPRTNELTLIRARNLALKAGLNFVYAGNIDNQATSTTFCQSCKKPLIIRERFNVLQNILKNGKCPECNERIPGVWN